MSVEHGQPPVDNGLQTTADQLAEMKAYGRQRLSLAERAATTKPDKLDQSA
jgi:hypothetical protein